MQGLSDKEGSMYILLYLIALPVIYIATFRNDFDKEVMSRAYPFIFLCSVVMLVMLFA